jgi:2-polyprenyl-6-methoxyphenol hydroxylase-like FAD-dependent oxidoreductase
MHELGILDEFLQIPHQKLRQFTVAAAGKSITLADFSKLRVRCPFVAFMPQWDFLDFIAEQAGKLPSFHLLMEHAATGLVVQSGRITGVQVSTRSGPATIHANLTIAADGRSSVLRQRAGLPLAEIGAPIDVLWMRVPKDPAESTEFLARFARGAILITIDRGDYWQCAYVLPKGRIGELREQGIAQLRNTMVKIMPTLRQTIGAIESWDDCSLLSVAVNHLTKWWQPGFLCIGDAAHAMSPVGGVGINLAIQDAVAAANTLVPAFTAGDAITQALQAIQQRRHWPARVTQRFQVFVQDRILANVLFEQTADPIPASLRVLQALPVLQRIPARVIGIGIRPEHITTAAAATSC